MIAINNEYLRHTLSTIAYRFQKSVNKSNADFGDLSLGHGTRTPNEIINHMYQVLNATKAFIRKEDYINTNPEVLSLDQEIDRFNSGLLILDKVFSNKEIGVDISKRLLQGPLSDILTHIGQLSMMRRLNGSPIEKEDFSAAPIRTGTLSYFGITKVFT
jgi:hypothetical protein